MSPQIKSSAVSLYRCFKAADSLKFLVGALYKLNIINLDDLVSGSTAQISKSFLYNYVKYLHCCNIGLCKQK